MDYQRELDEAAADSFLEGFEDCRTKVLREHPEVDMSCVSPIDASSMPQDVDSPSTGDMKAFTAPPEEDDIVRN